MIATAPAPSTPTLDFRRFYTALEDRSVLQFQGRVAQVIGLSIEVEGLRLAVGDVCTILPEMAGRRTLHGSEDDLAERRAGGISAEVVGFRENRLIVMPFSDTHGVRPGSAVFPRGPGVQRPGRAVAARPRDRRAGPADRRQRPAQRHRALARSRTSRRTRSPACRSARR